MPQPTALITGASAGIGRACAMTLAEAGYQLILVARRHERLTALCNELSNTACHPVAVDVRDTAAVDLALSALPEPFKEIDVLLNNAGLALGLNPADTASWQDWQTMIDTNCKALSYITWKLLPDMKARNTGTIINVGSTAGNYAYPGGNVYGATKAFVHHFSAGLRADLINSKLRVCSLEPGLIGGTEFSNVRFHGDDQKAASVYDNCQPLAPEDIAEAVRWVVSLPTHVNINRLEVMPVCQASAGLAVSKGG